MSPPKVAAKLAPEPTHVLAPTLVREVCMEKQRLREELRSAMNDIINLTVRQLEAARIEHESGMEQFLGRRIADLRHRKDNLLEFYKAHVAWHRC